MKKVSLVIAAALITSTFAAAANADEPTKRSRALDAPATAKVSGIIVRTTSKKTPTAVIEKTDSLLKGKAEAVRITPVTAGTNTIVLNEAVSTATATTVAKSLERRDDVIWAEPNYIRHRTDAPPVTVNDPLFLSQLNVWDVRTPLSPDVIDVNGAANTFPRGGFSVKAPYFWRVSKGKPSTVVAVLDTGITRHPDLNQRVVRGYDMVDLRSESGVLSAFYANDGDGRDSNPADPGDWVAAGDCDGSNPAENSSWHGTHVAGIIAAQANNGIGVTGIAPGVKVQPVRVLGRCGGTDDDIIAGITWASGGVVPGVPANPTPARIINLSLGGDSPCPQSFVDAIAAARGRGSVIVVAAGNGAEDAANTSPANCAGVITVGASDEYGSRASYSNFGSTIDVSAPGGDNDGSGHYHGIISTYNDGTTAPGGPAYAETEGTSMAAPAVSAAAALIEGLGRFSGAQIESAVVHAVQPFTVGGNVDAQFLCVNPGGPMETNCGAGVIDLSAVPVPVTKTKVQGSAAYAHRLKARRGTWLGRSTVFTYVWRRGSIEVSRSTNPVYTVKAADIGKKMSVQVLGNQQGFPTRFAPVVHTATIAKARPSVSTMLSKSVRTSGKAKLTVKVTVYGVSAPTGTISVYDGSKRIQRFILSSRYKGRRTISLPKIKKEGTHKIKIVYSGNSKIFGRTATIRYLKVT